MSDWLSPNPPDIATPLYGINAMKNNFKAKQKIGDWSLIALIKSNANGDVFLCENQRRERFVIKICKKITSNSYYRFKTEIEATLLASEIVGVVKIIDYRLPPKKFTEDFSFVPYYVMRRGMPLLTFLRDKDISKKIEFIIVLAYSLHQLHKKKIYHRDIKPTNILVLEEIPIFIDFGISKIPK